MTTFIEFFQYPFFVRALVVGSVIGLLLSWMSTYIVLRREVLFTHALSNIGFLGIALGILFNVSITFSLIAACLLGALLINVVQRKKLFANDSLLGIFSQMGLALAIIVIAFFPGYRVNIEQFLFGDILGVTEMDMWLSFGLLALVGVILVFFHKRFLMISLSDELSHTLVKNKKFWHGLLIVLLALLIAMAMRVVGVLLVAAFTTIPSNVSKLLAKNMMQTFVGSVLVGLIGVLAGLYGSIIFDAPSGAMIVIVMGAIWGVGVTLKKFVR